MCGNERTWETVFLIGEIHINYITLLTAQVKYCKKVYHKIDGVILRSLLNLSIERTTYTENKRKLGLYNFITFLVEPTNIRNAKEMERALCFNALSVSV